MQSTFSRSEFIDALRAIGLSTQKTVGIVSDLARLGTLEVAPGKDALGSYIDCIRAVVGQDATIVVPTFTYFRGGEGNPFVHEETPSETGLLTEYVRKLPGSRRSVHPVFSFAAAGPGSGSIIDDASSHSYGARSPAHRLIGADAFMICLGLAPQRGTFLLHVAEVMAGVPYRYTKELQIPVIVGGKRLDRSFFHFVKYADADLAWDTNRIVERLQTRRQLSFAPVGASGVWGYRAAELVETTVGLLTRNVYGLLACAPKSRPWLR